MQLYVTCNHIITDDINQLCLLVAVTSLNNEENIRLIVREFEALDIKTFEQAHPITDLINPYEFISYLKLKYKLT
ncbi:hypothetical protein ACPV4O_25110 [Vibrio owensii]|uniref:hypothetical protein n=1 Tax=Vibrio owensii TaxID=696485 RepID=UPI00406836F3